MIEKIFGLLFFFGIMLLTGVAGGLECDTIDDTTFYILSVVGIGLIISGYIGLRKMGGHGNEKSKDYQ